jgi:hypothetical protein
VGKSTTIAVDLAKSVFEVADAYRPVRAIGSPRADFILARSPWGSNERP